MKRLYPCLSLLALAAGCAGPPIPAPIEGEPVCPDVEIGAAHTKMQGGLRFPVQVKVMEGKTLVFRTIVKGLRSADDRKTHTFFVDDNQEFTIEWAQCSNERAPRPVPSAHEAKDKSKDKEVATYDCGEARVYKTEKLVTKKGDKGSHKLTFPAPPNAACWAGEAPGAPNAADAGAPDAAASPQGEDAGSAMDASSSDAGAPTSDAGAAAVDAGAAATDAGTTTKK